MSYKSLPPDFNFPEQAPGRAGRVRRGKAPAEPPYDARLATPFAVLGIRADQDGLRGIDYLPLGAPVLAPQNAMAERVCREIKRYLKDPEYRLKLPLLIEGTPFQRKVWDIIARIPYGKTLTYGAVARKMGMGGSGPRAVGGACGANRLPLVIPCHRVIATHGGLGGFMRANGGVGLDIKRWLLEHEGVSPEA